MIIYFFFAEVHVFCNFRLWNTFTNKSDLSVFSGKIGIVGWRVGQVIINRASSTDGNPYIEHTRGSMTCPRLQQLSFGIFCVDGSFWRPTDHPVEGRVSWLIVFCLVTIHNGFRCLAVKLINTPDLMYVSVIYDVLSKRRVVESRGIARQDIWLACLNKTSCSIEKPQVSWQINNTIDGNLIERRNCRTSFDPRMSIRWKLVSIRRSLKSYWFHEGESDAKRREEQTRWFRNAFYSIMKTRVRCYKIRLYKYTVYQRWLVILGSMRARMHEGKKNYL